MQVSSTPSSYPSNAPLSNTAQSEDESLKIYKKVFNSTQFGTLLQKVERITSSNEGKDYLLLTLHPTVQKVEKQTLATIFTIEHEKLPNNRLVAKINENGQFIVIEK